MSGESKRWNEERLRELCEARRALKSKPKVQIEPGDGGEEFARFLQAAVNCRHLFGPLRDLYEAVETFLEKEQHYKRDSTAWERALNELFTAFEEIEHAYLPKTKEAL